MGHDGQLIRDQVAVALVECGPEPVQATPTPVVPLETPTPVVAAQQATVEHTGADPPPET